MSQSLEREKLITEVNRIPDDKLAEVYTLLHYYRLGLESTQKQPPDVMRYAGCWADMPADEFEDFLQEIQVRRRQAFSGRRRHETRVD
ncbi:MAG: hypothetical protein ACLFTI_13605 [Anaerolineales bacterium]